MQNNYAYELRKKESEKMKEIELNVADRIRLGMFLSQGLKGKYAFVKGVNELKQNVFFTDEEMTVWEIRMEDIGKGTQTWHWNEKVEARKFEIGDVVFEGIAAKLKELDDAGEITTDLLNLCDIFELEG